MMSDDEEYEPVAPRKRGGAFSKGKARIRRRTVQEECYEADVQSDASGFHSNEEADEGQEDEEPTVYDVDEEVAVYNPDEGVTTIIGGGYQNSILDSTALDNKEFLSTSKKARIRALAMEFAYFERELEVYTDEEGLEKRINGEPKIAYVGKKQIQKRLPNKKVIYQQRKVTYHLEEGEQIELLAPRSIPPDATKKSFIVSLVNPLVDYPDQPNQVLRYVKSFRPTNNQFNMIKNQHQYGNTSQEGRFNKVSVKFTPDIQQKILELRFGPHLDYNNPILPQYEVARLLNTTQSSISIFISAYFEHHNIQVTRQVVPYAKSPLDYLPGNNLQIPFNSSEVKNEFQPLLNFRDYRAQAERHYQVRKKAKELVKRAEGTDIYTVKLQRWQLHGEPRIRSYCKNLSKACLENDHSETGRLLEILQKRHFEGETAERQEQIRMRCIQMNLPFSLHRIEKNCFNGEKKQQKLEIRKKMINERVKNHHRHNWKMYAIKNFNVLFESFEQLLEGSKTGEVEQGVFERHALFKYYNGMKIQEEWNLAKKEEGSTNETKTEKVIKDEQQAALMVKSEGAGEDDLVRSSEDETLVFKEDNKEKTGDQLREKLLKYFLEKKMHRSRNYINADIEREKRSYNRTALVVARWTPNDKEQFVKLYKLYGRDMKKISEELGNKSIQQCQNYRLNLMLKIKQGKIYDQHGLYDLLDKDKKFKYPKKPVKVTMKGQNKNPPRAFSQEVRKTERLVKSDDDDDKGVDVKSLQDKPCEQLDWSPKELAALQILTDRYGNQSYDQITWRLSNYRSLNQVKRQVDLIASNPMDWMKKEAIKGEIAVKKEEKEGDEEEGTLDVSNNLKAVKDETKLPVKNVPYRLSFQDHQRFIDLVKEHGRQWKVIDKLYNRPIGITYLYMLGNRILDKMYNSTLPMDEQFAQKMRERPFKYFQTVQYNKDLVELVKKHKGQEKEVSKELSRCYSKVTLEIGQLRKRMVEGKFEKDPEFLKLASRRRPWCPQETEQLMSLILEHQQNWEQISEKIVSRSAVDCQRKAMHELKMLKSNVGSLNEEGKKLLFYLEMPPPKVHKEPRVRKQRVQKPLFTVDRDDQAMCDSDDTGSVQRDDDQEDDRPSWPSEEQSYHSDQTQSDPAQHDDKSAKNQSQKSKRRKPQWRGLAPDLQRIVDLVKIHGQDWSRITKSLGKQDRAQRSIKLQAEQALKSMLAGQVKSDREFLTIMQPAKAARKVDDTVFNLEEPVKVKIESSGKMWSQKEIDLFISLARKHGNDFGKYASKFKRRSIGALKSQFNQLQDQIYEQDEEKEDKKELEDNNGPKEKSIKWAQEEVDCLISTVKRHGRNFDTIMAQLIRKRSYPAVGAKMREIVTKMVDGRMPLDEEYVAKMKNYTVPDVVAQGSNPQEDSPTKVKVETESVISTAAQSGKPIPPQLAQNVTRKRVCALRVKTESKKSSQSGKEGGSIASEKRSRVSDKRNSKLELKTEQKVKVLSERVALEEQIRLKKLQLKELLKKQQDAFKSKNEQLKEVLNQQANIGGGSQSLTSSDKAKSQEVKSQETTAPVVQKAQITPTTTQVAPQLLPATPFMATTFFPMPYMSSGPQWGTNCQHDHHLGPFPMQRMLYNPMLPMQPFMAPKQPATIISPTQSQLKQP